MMKLKDNIFLRRSIWESLHWHRNGLKIPKVIVHHILLEGDNAIYDDFSILIPENNQFKLHLKESLLIKRDKPEFNRNIYTHTLELFV